MKRILLAVALIGSLSAQAQTTLNDAIRAMDIEQYQKSKDLLKVLMNNDPGDADLCYYMGENYFRTGDFDSARYYFDQGVSLNSLSPLSFIGLGELELLNGKGNDALNTFNKALAMNKGKDFNAHLLVGQAFTNSEGGRNLTAGFDFLTKAQAIDSKNPALYIALGDVALERANGTEATKNYEMALSLDKNNPKPYVRQGLIYKRALNFEVSKEYYDKALALDPNYPPAYRELGELWYKAGKYDKAIENYKRYVELTDNSIGTQVRYASFLFLTKDYKQTIQIIEDVLKKDTTKNICYRLLGYSAYESKDYPRALQAMNTFFSKWEPSRLIPSDYAYLGKAQIKNKMDSVGLQTLRTAIEQDSVNTDLLSDLGEALYQQKKFAESAATYESKKDRKGLTATEYFFWGRSLYFAKDYVKSDSAFAKLIQVQPTFATAYLYRGRINAALDPEMKSGAAKTFYDKVIEMLGADPVKNKRDLVEAYEYVAAYSFFKLEKEKATELFTKLKEIDPENKKANAFFTQKN